RFQQQIESYKEQIKKIGDDGKKQLGTIEQKDEAPTCGICHKTKFAEGCGNVCSYCQTRFCARCGFRFALRPGTIPNIVMWLCTRCRKQQDLLVKSGTLFHNQQPLGRLDGLLVGRGPEAQPGLRAGLTERSQSQYQLSARDKERVVLEPQQPDDRDAACTALNNNDGGGGDGGAPQLRTRNDPAGDRCGASLLTSSPQQGLRSPARVSVCHPSSQPTTGNVEGPRARGDAQNGRCVESNPRDKEATRLREQQPQQQQQRRRCEEEEQQQQQEPQPEAVYRYEPGNVHFPPVRLRAEEAGLRHSPMDSARSRNKHRFSDPTPPPPHGEAAEDPRQPPQGDRRDVYARQQVAADYRGRRSYSEERIEHPVSARGNPAPFRNPNRGNPSTDRQNPGAAERAPARASDARGAQQGHPEGGPRKGKRGKPESVLRNDSLSSDQSESMRPPPPQPKPHRVRKGGRRRHKSVSSSEEELASTPECSSCEDAEVESEGFAERGNLDYYWLEHSSWHNDGSSTPAQPVTWQPSNEGDRLIGKIVLNKTLTESAMPKDSGALLGLKRILFWKKTNMVFMLAFCTTLHIKGKLQCILNRIHEWDEVLEWNGQSLQGATFQEVYNIILESKPEPLVELLVSRPIGDLPRIPDGTHGHQESSSSSFESQKLERRSISLNTPTSPGLRDVPQTMPGRLSIKLWYDKVGFQLVVTTLGATDLPLRDDGQPRNPYIKIYFLPDRSDKSKRRTTTVGRSLEPQWNQTFAYCPVQRREFREHMLELTLWDQQRSPGEESVFLGEILIELETALLDDNPHWYKLQSHDPSSLPLPQPSPFLPRKHGQGDNGRKLQRSQRIDDDMSDQDYNDAIGVVSTAPFCKEGRGGPSGGLHPEPPTAPHHRSRSMSPHRSEGGGGAPPSRSPGIQQQRSLDQVIPNRRSRSPSRLERAAPRGDRQRAGEGPSYPVERNSSLLLLSAWSLMTLCNLLYPKTLTGNSKDTYTDMRTVQYTHAYIIHKTVIPQQRIDTKREALLLNNEHERRPRYCFHLRLLKAARSPNFPEGPGVGSERCREHRRASLAAARISRQARSLPRWPPSARAAVLGTKLRGRQHCLGNNITPPAAPGEVTSASVLFFSCCCSRAPSSKRCGDSSRYIHDHETQTVFSPHISLLTRLAQHFISSHPNGNPSRAAPAAAASEGPPAASRRGRQLPQPPPKDRLVPPAAPEAEERARQMKLKMSKYKSATIAGSGRDLEREVYSKRHLRIDTLRSTEVASGRSSDSEASDLSGLSPTSSGSWISSTSYMSVQSERLRSAKRMSMFTSRMHHRQVPATPTGTAARGVLKSTSVSGDMCALKNDGSQSDTALGARGSGGKKRRPNLGSKMVAMVGLRSRSASQITQTDSSGRKLRSTVKRSTETGMATTLRSQLTRQESTDDSITSGMSEGSLMFPGLMFGGGAQITDFLDGLGPAQLVGRQTLATPPMGEIQISMVDKKGQLEVEVIRAKGLFAKPSSKTLPAPYVKVYLLENGAVIAKKKTKIARKTLDPLYQQPLVFEQSPSGKVLQVIVWGDYGRMDHKSFMGAARIVLEELDLSNMVIGWYKLFPTSSLIDTTVAPLTRGASQTSLDSSTSFART
uniref:Regulating synaptic membrane exocytosis 2a n=1 Tax=Petromyzon marinus TaxID=7757 RepID=S4R8A2_PETMA